MKFNNLLERDNDLKRKILLQSYSLNEEMIDKVLEDQSKQVVEYNPYKLKNKSLTPRNVLNHNMRSPDLKRAKQIESICVYDKYLNNPNAVNRKMLFKDTNKFQSPVMDKYNQTLRNTKLKILRRNKKTFNIKKFSINKRKGKDMNNKADLMENKLKDDVNIYSNNFKTKKMQINSFKNNYLDLQDSGSPNNISSRMNKNINRKYNLSNTKHKSNFKKQKYMSVDKYHTNRPNSIHVDKNNYIQNKNKKKNFIKQLLEKKEQAHIVMDQNKFKNKGVFTSPDLTKKNLMNDKYKEIFRSKTKENKMKKSGNSFFKISIKKKQANVHNKKPILR